MNSPPRVDPGPRVEAIENFLKEKVRDCPNGCGTRVFWVRSNNGNWLLLDFAPSEEGTYELVPTAKDRTYTGEVTALKRDTGKYTYHWGHCKGGSK